MKRQNGRGERHIQLNNSAGNEADKIRERMQKPGLHKEQMCCINLQYMQNLVENRFSLIYLSYLKDLCKETLRS